MKLEGSSFLSFFLTGFFHTPLFMASPENHCFPNLEIF